MTDRKVDKLLHRLYVTIDRALDETSLLKPQRIIDGKKPAWFTQRLAEFRDKFQIAYRRMKTSFNSATTKKMSKIQYKREIRRRKRQAWNRHKSAIADTGGMASFIKSIEKHF